MSATLRSRRRRSNSRKRKKNGSWRQTPLLAKTVRRMKQWQAPRTRRHRLVRRLRRASHVRAREKGRSLWRRKNQWAPRNSCIEKYLDTTTSQARARPGQKQAQARSRKAEAGKRKPESGEILAVSFEGCHSEAQ